MSAINWAKGDATAAFEYIGSVEGQASYYVAPRRPDGYYDIFFRGEKINDKRVRLGVAKDLAQAHADANNTPVVLDSFSEKMNEVVETAEVGKPTKMVFTEPPTVEIEIRPFHAPTGIKVQAPTEVEQRSDPTTDAVPVVGVVETDTVNPVECVQGPDSSAPQTTTTTPVTPASCTHADNWLFLGAALALLMVRHLSNGHDIMTAARLVVKTGRSKNDRRRIRRLFRENGYQSLAA